MSSTRMQAPAMKIMTATVPAEESLRGRRVDGMVGGFVCG